MAWGGSSGEGVKVTVVDSGIDATHPDIGDVQGYVAIHEGVDLKLVYDTGPARQLRPRHRLREVIRSIAPACELYSVDLGEETRQGRVFAAGLRWAIDNGMHVCNLSLGTTKRDFFSIFHELADDAYFKNVALITTARPASRYRAIRRCIHRSFPLPHMRFRIRTPSFTTRTRR